MRGLVAWVLAGIAIGVASRHESSGTQTWLLSNAVVDFRQAANDDSPLSLGDVHWINSISQQNNSMYFEGMSMPQRIVFDDIPSTAPSNEHTLTFNHQANKGEIHAYDFLTSWEQAVAAANAISPTPPGLLTNGASPAQDFYNDDPCDEEIGPPGSLGATCGSLRTCTPTVTCNTATPFACGGGTSSCAKVVIPDVVNDTTPPPGNTFGQNRITHGSPAHTHNVADRICTYEAQFGERTVTIYGNTPITNAWLEFHGYSDGTDHNAEYTLHWTSTSERVLIEMAGHLAVDGDAGCIPENVPGCTCVGYGPGTGAASIDGGPYHFKLETLDGASLGSRDNQIKGADILVDCCPLGATDPGGLCDDGIACTIDACDESVMTCPNGNEACTHTPDHDACDDNNPCTDCVCDPVQGCLCTIDDSNNCKDALFCNGNEKCVGGVCVSGPDPCDDGINCTNDSCNEVTDMCTNTPVDSKCPDDGNPCSDQVCNPAIGCEIVCDDTNLCEDGLFCNGVSTCVNCVCTDGADPCPSDGFACTNDFCDEVADECKCIPNHSTCQNGSFCDGTEQCVCGVGCVDGPDPCAPPLLCSEGADPDDNLGNCKGCLTDADCQNGLFCDGVEFCDSTTGTCKDGPDPCAPDGLDCTIDFCDEGADLTDNLGNCKNVPNHMFCDDGNVCTDDVCDPLTPPPSTGCTYTCNMAGCDDGDRCTINDQCSGATPPCACAGTSKDCSHLNDQCNEGRCDPATGDCVKVPINEGLICDDEFFCTIGDMCVNGMCVGTPNPCDDVLYCTNDSCDEVNDVCINLPNDSKCEDPSFCNGNEFCSPPDRRCLSAGVKCPEDPYSCTTITCDETTRTCGCVVDHSRCDDFNPCTDDVCVCGVGCVNTADDSNLCTDGLFCTCGDICVSGVCTPQASGAACCDDGIPCTNDFCDEAQAICIYKADDTKCDDGLFCNGNEKCDVEAGGCVDGPEPCVGGPFICATLTCDEVTFTCRPTPNDALCDDGDACTTERCNAEVDFCVRGLKSGWNPTTECCDPATGNETLIDDGDACTVDTCSPGPVPPHDPPDSGNGVATHTIAPSSTPCEDGNPCTTADRCDGTRPESAGGCIGTDVNTLNCVTSNDCPLDPNGVHFDCGTATPGKCFCTGEPPIDLGDLKPCVGGSRDGLACRTDRDCPDDGFCDLFFGGANCFDSGDIGEKVTARVHISRKPRPINGGQFVIRYDPDCLEFISVVGLPPYTGFLFGPFVTEIDDTVCPNGGLCDPVTHKCLGGDREGDTCGSIFVAVAVDPFCVDTDPDPLVDSCDGPRGDVDMLSLSFNKIGACNVCELCFGPEVSPRFTYLVDDQGHKVPIGSCIGGANNGNSCLMDDQCPDGRCSTPVCKTLRAKGDFVLDVPDNIETNVDCDRATARASWAAPSASYICGTLTLTCRGTHESGFVYSQDVVMNGGVFPIGLSTFCCNAVADDDPCGARVGCAGAVEDCALGSDGKPIGCWTVEVLNEMSLDIDVQLEPPIATSGEFTRCIKFCLFRNCAEAPVCFSDDVVFGGLFNVIGKSQGKIKIPGFVHWLCMTAQDQLHALRSCYTFAPADCAGGQLSASFHGDPRGGGDWLIGGNLDGWKKNDHLTCIGGTRDSLTCLTDAECPGGKCRISSVTNPDEASLDVIDILDFGTFVSQIDVTYADNDTPCGTLGPNADINGDGDVDMLDYNFVLRNFLVSAKDCCCVSQAAALPWALAEVSVDELRQMGYDNLVVADLNGDGVLNADDMDAFMQGARPAKSHDRKGGKGLRSGR